MSFDLTGGCQCGRVRYRVATSDDDGYLCHCRMCQRATGGVAAALKEVSRTSVTWEREPDRYRSSPIAQRGFCAVCGTPLTYEGDGSVNLDLTVGSFDEPERLRPVSVTGIESRHDRWVDTSMLPATRTDENTGIVAKWIASVASSPTDPRFFASFDGVRLAWREMGPDGARPVVLLHGFFSDAATNWVRYGHAAAIAARGRRVIMLDLRAHGDSERPHDRAAYPPDVLARDGHALIAHLGLVDYDLGGYSLGARTTVRMLATGATPGRVVISGMGLEGLTDTGKRAGHFRRILTGLGSFERGSPEWLAEAFLKTTGGDPQALLGLLDTFVDTPVTDLQRISPRTLVVAGREDADNGSAPALADALPQGCYAEVPGGHMSAVVKPELGEAIAAFLAD